jgi:small subunit ribosomal protein S20
MSNRHSISCQAKGGNLRKYPQRRAPLPKSPLTPGRPFESLTGSTHLSIMANTKSAIKAARKSVRLTTRNSGVKTRLKTLHKKLNTAIAAKDAAATKAAASAYTSAMDKAVKSGVVHRNAASRAKAHSAKFVFAK